ncbi:hypothetical protein MAPG_08757, partial [Magnaporthiopsis poae ATCC 64411]|uniref:Uncharacterized protein n=1 Tax=Magnaporthiopsis poae (strain ATCC 64411 / 73-15) TaxID=644358 RepID=A0A0C4E867_MAGP6
MAGCEGHTKGEYDACIQRSVEGCKKEWERIQKEAWGEGGPDWVDVDASGRQGPSVRKGLGCLNVNGARGSSAQASNTNATNGRSGIALHLGFKTPCSNVAVARGR